MNRSHERNGGALRWAAATAWFDGMGYRELLKKYIRFLEVHAGDNYIEAITYAAPHELADRDLAELRTLAGEIHREIRSADVLSHCPQFNHRLRLLCMCYGLSAEQTARFAGVDAALLRHWRANPRSARYVAMHEEEFLRFEAALCAWLKERRHSANEDVQ